MTIKTPTIQEINEFTAFVVADMTQEERDNWDTLSKFERQSIAWCAWIALNNAKAA